MFCSNPNHNAHVETIEITYPYPPQFGQQVVVNRQCKRGGQDMYDAVDVHGGSSGIPIWMTEAQWKELRITGQIKVPLKILQELSTLLAKQKSCSNRNETFDGGQGNDDQETAITAATAEVEQATSERSNTGRVSAPVNRIVTAGTLQ